MNRIIVVGPPGSGKTTISAAIADKLGIAHVELDSLWWDADWTEAGPVEFGTRAGAVITGDRWVVDGNYFSNGARELIWPEADTVVWLDLPRRVTVPRVVWRSANRSVRRTELWNGNREPLRQVFRRDAIIRFAWREHPNYAERYEGLDGDPSLSHLTWIRLCARDKVRQWLAELPKAGAL